MAFGILIGAITGANISWLLLLLPVVVLNVPLRAFAASWAATVLLAGCARTSIEQLGRLLLDGTPLGPTLGRMGDGVLTALLGWHQYAFAGGAALGLALAAVGALVVYVILRLPVGDESPDDPDWPPSPAAGANPAWRTYPASEAVSSPAVERPLLRIIADDADRPARAIKPRKLRPHAFALAAAASLLIVPACWWIAGSLARRNFVAVLSQANGGEVAVGRFGLSLLTGEFVAGEFSAADPERADRSRLSIGLAKGVLSPGLLLRGYLDVKRLVLTDVRTDRRSPADAARSRDAFDRNPSASDVDLSNSIACWKEVCRGLGSLQRLIVAVEGFAEIEESAMPADDSAFSIRSDLGLPRPLIRLRNLRVADLANSPTLGPKSLLELTELSSNPRLTGKAAEIKIVAPKFAGQLELVLSHDGPNKKHSLRFSACDLDLVPLVTARRVNVAGGQARMSGAGSVNRRSMNVRVTVDVDSLAAEIAGGSPWAGIDPTVLNRGLRRLNGFVADIFLTGTFSAPGLRVDSQSLIAEFKQQLRSAGEFALAETLQREFASRRPTELGAAVVPASAVEPDANPTHPGWAGFNQEAEQPPAVASMPDDAAAEVAAGPVSVPDSYPATATPDVEPEYAAPPIVHAPARVARPLPGPMNLVVGHDPAIGFSSTFDRVGAVRPEGPVAPRQSNAISRWAQGLRGRIGHPPAQPAAPPSAMPAERPTAEQPEAVIPAAASEAWYNRRWR